MKFSEIKEKIQNLGSIKSLSEIKKAGLRICRNTKTGDYWLIEEEFLKPVISSPQECNSVRVKLKDLKYKVFICHESRNGLINKSSWSYIKWGEKRNFNNRPTCKTRKFWWSLEEIKSPIISKRFVDVDFSYFWNEDNLLVGDTFFVLNTRDNIYNKELVLFLNSTLGVLFTEIIGRKSMGEGVLLIYGPEIENLIVFKKNLIITKSINLPERKSIFDGLGINSSKPIRSQQPNPLPDRKALDDIVFDALGLTEQEREEVYWSVVELVKNRLEKAKNV
jgi:hypothetical protein